MGLIPAYRLTANNVDITTRFKDRVSSLYVSLESDHHADELQILLSDTDPTHPIIRPPLGAVLSLDLGYEGALVDQGKYVVSSLGGSGGAFNANVFVITARAAPYAETPDGMSSFQTQKTRSWRRGTTIGAMVEKMAREHGMISAVSKDLAPIALSHYDQTEESDISFLQRLGRQYDAVAKPAGGKLLFVARGTSRSASGQQLSQISLSRKDVSTWSWDIDGAISPGTVVAMYHAAQKGMTRAISIGSGDPVRRIKRKFRNAADAHAAARSEMARRARGAMRLALTLPGNARISAETTLSLDRTFTHGTDGVWLAKRVIHRFDSFSGFVTELEGERPNSDPGVSTLLNKNIADETVDSA